MKKKMPAIRLRRRLRNAKGNPKIVEAGKATQFKPGVSGNPSGRPIDLVSRAIRRVLALPYPRDRQGRTYAQVVAMALVDRAIKGDVQAARELADRTEGKPVQAIQLSGEVDLGLPIEELDKRIQSVTDRIRARAQAAKEAAAKVH